MLIGVSGRIGAGKDVACNYFRDRYGFERAAFAGKLKDAAAVIFGFTPEQLHGRLKEKLDPYWELTPRDVLQRMGTEAMRETFGPLVWVKALFHDPLIWSKDVAISDVRFISEVEAVKQRGGFVIRLKRNDPPRWKRSWWWRALGYLRVVPRVHRSEIELDDYQGWDVVIDNNTTLEELYRQLDVAFVMFKEWNARQYR